MKTNMSVVFNAACHVVSAEEFQSLVRISSEPYISQYNDTSSPEFRDFQNKFCAQVQ